MKFAFYTLGCKVNRFETQALTQIARTRGHEIVERDADAVIVNTCTVTGISDHKNFRAIHKLRRENPRAVIAACGCFAEMSPEKLRAGGEVDLVFGTGNRVGVIDACETAVRERSTLTGDTPQAGGPPTLVGGPTRRERFELLPAGVPAGRTRALLKIEDGCDNYCAYCIIPYARGHVRSMPVEAIFSEVQRLQDTGVQEIVLTGIEIASYGRDLDSSLIALLPPLLSAFPAIRFRLGSLDPRCADAQFCTALRGFANIAPHFHLSLQSGCDTVLQRMGRHYTTAVYAEHVRLLRDAFPDCSITTDIIAGFPGETEDEFAETLNFLRSCELSAVHAFPYSMREGTRAASMPDQLPQTVREERAARIRQEAAALSAQYRTHFIGRSLSALPEHYADGYWTAHAGYCFPLYLQGSAFAKNTPETVRLTNLFRDGLLAEKIPSGL